MRPGSGPCVLAVLEARERAVAEEAACGEQRVRDELRKLADEAAAIAEDRRDMERERWAQRRAAAREQLQRRQQGAEGGGLGPALHVRSCDGCDTLVALPGRPLRPFVVTGAAAAGTGGGGSLRPGLPVTVAPATKGMRLLGGLVAAVGADGAARFAGVSVVAKRGSCCTVVVTYPSVGGDPPRVGSAAVHVLGAALCIEGELAWEPQPGAATGEAAPATLRERRLCGTLRLRYVSAPPGTAGAAAAPLPCAAGLPLVLTLVPARPQSAEAAEDAAEESAGQRAQCGADGQLSFSSLSPAAPGRTACGYELRVAVRGAGLPTCGVLPLQGMAEGGGGRSVEALVTLGAAPPWRDRAEWVDAGLLARDEAAEGAGGGLTSAAAAAAHRSAAALCCSVSAQGRSPARGCWAAIGCADGAVRLWQPCGGHRDAGWELGLTLSSSDRGGDAVSAVAWGSHPGAEYLCVAAPGRVLVWERAVLDTWRQFTVPQLPAATAHAAVPLLGGGSCTALAAAHCSAAPAVAAAVSAAAPLRVSVWRLDTAAPVCHVEVPTRVTQLAALSALPRDAADGPRAAAALVVGDEQGCVVLWDIPAEGAAGSAGQALLAPDRCRAQLPCATASPGAAVGALCVAQVGGSDAVVVGDGDGGLRLLTLPALAPLPPPPEGHPDGGSGGSERREAGCWLPHGVGVSALCAAGRFAASAAGDGSVAVWDLELLGGAEAAESAAEAVLAETRGGDAVRALALCQLHEAGDESPADAVWKDYPQLVLGLLLGGEQGCSAHCVRGRHGTGAPDRPWDLSAPPPSPKPTSDGGAPSAAPAEAAAAAPPAAATGPPAIAPASSNESEHSGSPPRTAPAAPYLGIQVKDVPGGGGVAAIDCAAGGPAQQAGLERGDVILALNGAPLAGSAAFREALRGAVVGQPLQVQRLRADGSGPDEVTLYIQQRPAGAPQRGRGRHRAGHSAAGSPPRSVSPQPQSRTYSPPRPPTGPPPPFRQPGSTAGNTSAPPSVAEARAASSSGSHWQLPVALPDQVRWTAEEIRNLSAETFDHTTPQARFAGFLKANGLHPPNPSTESAMRRAIVDFLARVKQRRSSGGQQGPPGHCGYVNWWRLTRPPPGLTGVTCGTAHSRRC
eukprot:TRINITY_DN13927_c0_g1_i3.p1 TRINITY_DN13927_c0_g1~~TRINITY_DN13927_c0_g1_i3.p1  ORF type:complete len:1128 (+),score=177.14 TRINITY_DN13927_c0_g1_i3:570-3953(+)